MNVAIINYNAGNVRSVLFAMERLGIQAELTNHPESILAADKVIFPGVGEANTTMAYLREHRLDQLIKQLKQPVLGICLGMQLLCDYSEENDTTCLGIIPQKVARFRPDDPQIKVPHIGWNQITDLSTDLFSSTEDQSYVYFVHSYFVEKGPFTIATCDYVQPFSAAVKKDNFYATQFHPEKSGSVGERILKGFLDM
ncbi:MAG: imidazole glycerol phosphate synthase subunit HisH [Bacteroidota bacterium]